jgi:hypothetical protein
VPYPAIRRKCRDESLRLDKPALFPVNTGCGNSRHQDEGAVSGDHVVDDFSLPPAERGIAVDGPQDGERLERHGKLEISNM